MKTVTFKFDLDQEVITPFGQEGFVSLQGVDFEGAVYYVKTEINNDWFKERQLTIKD